MCCMDICVFLQSKRLSLPLFFDVKRIPCCCETPTHVAQIKVTLFYVENGQSNKASMPLGDVSFCEEFAECWLVTYVGISLTKKITMLKSTIHL